MDYRKVVVNNVISYRQLLQIEKSFTEESFPDESGFLIKEGRIPFLVSAPHSVSQIRDGKWKIGEHRSGIVVEELQRLTGCYSIYKTKNNQEDANFDKKSSYRDAIINLVKKEKINYLLDIHIMSPNRP